MRTPSRTLLLLGAIGWLAAGCSRAPAETNPSAETPAAPQAPELDPRTKGWEAGQWYAYALRMDTSVSFGDRPSVIDFEVGGIVQITPTATSSESATLYLAMADPKVVAKDPAGQPQFDKIAGELAGTGVFFGLSGGRITEMRAPRGLSATAGNIYREIGAALQFTATNPVSPRYTAEEYDTTGQYVAEYELDRDLKVWHKRKQKYVALLGAKNATQFNTPSRVVPQIDQSEGDVGLFADGRPQSIDIRNKVTVNGAQQPVHSTSSLSLQARRSEPARTPGPDWNALMSGMQRTGADEPYGATPTVDSLDQARINGMTFDKALSFFEELAKEKGRPASAVNGASLDPDEKARQEQKTGDESRYFTALAAIFREQPDSVRKAVQKIKAKSLASDVLVEALSSASSPAAQAALVSLVESKAIASPQRTRVLMALSRTPNPDAKSIGMLEETLRSDPFNEIALLGLGTYSRRLREAGNSADASTIGQLLVQKLRDARKTGDILTSLRALTNSGYAGALADVTGYAKSPDDDIRVAAVRALQSMKDPKVDDVLADRMQSDVSSDVRISALSAAKVREPTDVLAHAVESTATLATDPRVRFHAVDLLAAWVARRPDVRSTLEQIGKSDGEVRIRDRAQSAL